MQKHKDAIFFLEFSFKTDFGIWYIVPHYTVHRTGSNRNETTPSVPDSVDKANPVPDPRTRTGANRKLGNYGFALIAHFLPMLPYPFLAGALIKRDEEGATGTVF